MLRRVVLLATLLIISSSCRTSDEREATTVVLDFDDDADPTGLELMRSYQFCPSSSNFNIINAYWLGAASAYAYATRATIDDVTTEIRNKWNGQVAFFSNDEQSAIRHHTQALWVELPDFAILSFRGTQVTAQDFATDFRVLSGVFDPNHPEFGDVHLGFRDGLDVIWPEVKAKILSMRGHAKPLYITGHSLGGALAVVATARIMMEDDFAEIAKNNMRGVYTFGSPRVGNEMFGKAFRDHAITHPDFHMVRFRNNMDVVTRVPSSRLYIGYEHIGPLYYFDESGRFYSSTSNVNFRRLFMPHDVSANMVENFADYHLHNFATKYTDHGIKNYLDKMNTEYGLSLAWTLKNQRDSCDMGMFASAWQQNPRPPEVKPFTNNLPIAAARTENRQEVKDCCWCYRTWYNSTWGYDEPFKQENFVGVIQEGEIASGNCMYPGGKAQGHLFWQGRGQGEDGRTYDQYYTYSACEGVTLKGNACIADREIFKNNQGTGKVIKASSWMP